MKKFITSFRQISLPARPADSRGVRRLNSTAVFKCALLTVVLLSGIVVAQAQQPDPLTITKDGKVGIGAPAPANKLTVAGDADFSGNVGIKKATPGVALDVGQNQAIRVGNANLSSGGDFVNLANNAWYNGSTWQSNGTAGGAYQISGSTHNWYRHNGAGVFLKAMTINADGNVGIGTTDPGDSKFRVTNAQDNFAHFRFDSSGNGGELVFLSWTDGWTIGSKTSGKKLYLNRLTRSDVLIGSSSDELVVKGDTGNVGIGTLTPTQAKLVVSGGVNKIPVGNIDISYFSEQDSPGKINRYKAADALRDKYIGPTVSIYASGNIWSGYSFVSSSDERIKKIEGRSDGATDLSTLLGIEITDYRHKDVIGKGNGTYKKVIGQQVEKVFPQAVSKHTDVVPDIYQAASIQDGWVTLTTDLKRGERVKLITEKGEESIHEVLEATPDKFRTDFNSEGNRVFVYGREVNDFLTVDYEAISMLNVSATQQIKKEKDEEVKALHDENAALRRQLAEQEKRLAELEAKDKARDEKLATIQSLLVSRAKVQHAKHH